MRKTTLARRGVPLEPTPVYTNRLQCEDCGRASRENERRWRAYLTKTNPSRSSSNGPEWGEREFGGRS